MKASSAELYANLMALCESGDTFFYADHTLDGLCYRIFNYRLSSYSEFMKPDALWCRGTMFRMDQDPVLVCRPMQKFFNLNEVSADINTLAQTLIKQGRLSEDVYLRAKKQHNQCAASKGSDLD